jgi:ABC-type Fe3+ transport system substrate-binding protein
MTDADDVWAAKARGLDVDLIYPSHGLNGDAGAAAAAATKPDEGLGTLLIPNTVARIKGGPNPAHATTLIDFLLSEEVERMLAESVSHNVAMRESVRQSFPQYEVPTPLTVDWDRIAPVRTKAIEDFFDALEAVKQEREEASQIKRDPTTTTQPEPEPLQPLQPVRAPSTVPAEGGPGEPGGPGGEADGG